VGPDNNNGSSKLESFILNKVSKRFGSLEYSAKIALSLFLCFLSSIILSKNIFELCFLI